ncbi:hypothetical protein COO60DRAFT_1483808 [Scenedesmus sp. NREL 46B-D3]|nr:hypothetical protein COO60DRAFT_1483808 [Scenedesmus sp. NREL 46B-D3]
MKHRPWQYYLRTLLAALCWLQTDVSVDQFSSVHVSASVSCWRCSGSASRGTCCSQAGVAVARSQAPVLHLICLCSLS